nr:MAG TPA: hypothetical protein [Caudoviricetes sp.]
MIVDKEFRASPSCGALFFVPYVNQVVFKS